MILHFPVWIVLGPFQLHPHPVFEALGYFLGYRLYRYLRKRQGDSLTDLRRLLVLAAAICGGAVGSKVLSWVEDWAPTLAHLHDLTFMMAGKTIVGGLLGGLIAVELVKKRVGLKEATGDLYALPLIVGIAVGRIGCFLTGYTDDTVGIPTTLPWGLDMGDGIRRHPTQLYEIAFLLLLGAFILWRQRYPYTPGDLFKLFMVGYLGWRLVVDFIKPYPHLLLGMCAIQLACLAALLYYAPHIPRLFVLRRMKGEEAHV